jgi:hypothetical protein
VFVDQMDHNYTHGIRTPPGWAAVSLGLADRRGSLWNDMEQFCDKSLPENSIYAVLHRERDRLFPDEMLADLFAETGRPVGAAVGGGDGDGAPPPGEPVGSRGGGALQLRHSLALRGRGGQLRLRWVGQLRAQRTRGLPGPAVGALLFRTFELQSTT